MAEYDSVPVPSSKLQWFVSALGPSYLMLLALAGFLAFILTVVLVIKGKGPLVGASLWFAVTMPLWVGVLGFFDGMIDSFIIIAQSTTSPKPAEVASGFSTALVTPLVGLWLMAPSFLVATLGSLIRSCIAKDHSA